LLRQRRVVHGLAPRILQRRGRVQRRRPFGRPIRRISIALEVEGGEPQLPGCEALRDFEHAVVDRHRARELTDANGDGVGKWTQHESTEEHELQHPAPERLVAAREARGEIVGGDRLHRRGVDLEAGHRLGDGFDEELLQLGEARRRAHRGRESTRQERGLHTIGRAQVRVGRDRQRGRHRRDGTDPPVQCVHAVSALW
jgi:hypothetical protein